MRASVLNVLALFALIVSASAQTNSPLSYATYFGGKSTDTITAMTVDTHGYLYVTGYTGSSDFVSTPGSYRAAANAGCANNTPCLTTFISKLRPDGAGVVFSTFFYGNTAGIAVDLDGNVYVAGNILSGDFPVTAGALNTPSGSLFVSKLSADGASLLYSARFGSGQYDQFDGFAVDRSGRAYLSVLSYSVNFPVTPGSYQSPQNGAYVVRLNANASALDYSARLGGADSGNLGRTGTRPQSIAVDSSGEAYIYGVSDSPTFPTTPNAYQIQRPQTPSGIPLMYFLSKLSADGSSLLYSTFFSQPDASGQYSQWQFPQPIAADDQGNAYIGGRAVAPVSTSGAVSFPLTPGVFQSHVPYIYNPNGSFSQTAFVAKIDTLQSGTPSLVFSTLLGTFSTAVGIAVDPNHNLYVSGTSSPSFPTTNNAIQRCGPVFVAKLSPDAKTLDFSTLIGQNPLPLQPLSNILNVAGLALAGVPDIFVAATTNLDFPTTPGVMRPANSYPASPKTSDGYLFKLDGLQLSSSGAALNLCADPVSNPATPRIAADVSSTKPVSSMRILVDGARYYEYPGVNSLETTLMLTNGTHNLTVEALGLSSGTLSRSTSVKVSGAQPSRISSLSPSSVKAGSASFTLTARGGPFSPSSVLKWNGSSLSTRFVDGSTLSATISSSLVKYGAEAWITVSTPNTPVDPYDNFSVFGITPVPAAPNCSQASGSFVITFCSPHNKAIVHSLVAVQVLTSASQSVYQVKVYVDGSLKYTNNEYFANVALPMSVGTHAIKATATNRTGSRSASVVVNVH